MPKLAAKDRKKVTKAEATTGGFEPITPGKYVAALSGVEARTSGNGNSMWNAEFHEIHDLDGNEIPGRQWMNLMLPIDTMPDDYVPGKFKKNGTVPTEAQKVEGWEQYQDLTAGRIKQFFESFGYTPDSDTDEMIGERCVIQIGIRTIQTGARAGEKSNEVTGIFPLDSVDFEDAGDGDGDDEF